MMLKVICILSTLTLLLPVESALGQDKGQSEQNLEYTVKAAFLYNFIKFVDWPAEKEADDKPIVIGIIGKDPFGKAFEPIKDKKVKGRKAVVSRFEGIDELEKSDKDSSEYKATIESLRKCHALFICSSEKERLKDIIALIQSHNVLTVGEFAGFLDSSGIINFLMEENKVRFEINLTASKKASLTIRSQLLRLAKQVIEEKSPDQAEN